MVNKLLKRQTPTHKSDQLRDLYAIGGYLFFSFLSLFFSLLFLVRFEQSAQSSVILRRSVAKTRRIQFQNWALCIKSPVERSLLSFALNKWPHTMEGGGRLEGASKKSSRSLIRFVVVARVVVHVNILVSNSRSCEYGQFASSGDPLRCENYFAPLSKNTQQVAKSNLNTTDLRPDCVVGLVIVCVCLCLCENDRANGGHWRPPPLNFPSSSTYHLRAQVNQGTTNSAG